MTENMKTVEQTLRDQVASLTQQVSSLSQQVSHQNQQIAHQTNAIMLMQAEKVQLEGTIDAAQKQRDYLLEREADALANLYILDKARQHEIDELKAELARVRQEFSPEAKKLAMMENDLNEARTKFGRAHHDKIQAIGKYQELESAMNEITSAMMWFAEEASESRTNIVKRFQEHANSDLSPEVILAAYRNSADFNRDTTTLVNYLLQTFESIGAEEVSDEEMFGDDTDSALINELSKTVSKANTTRQ